MYLQPKKYLTDDEAEIFGMSEAQREAHLKARETATDRHVEWEGALTEEEATAIGWSQELDPAPVTNRRTGWTAWRQRLFLEVLAQAGCVSDAARAAGVTPRSAYRLRCRADAGAFSAAWDRALVVAANRLTAIAFERAVNGRVKPVWYKGEIVGEERIPSDRLLVYLLQHFDKTRFGNLSGFTPHPVPDPRKQAVEELPDILKALEDHRFPSEAASQPLYRTAGDPIDPRDEV